MAVLTDRFDQALTLASSLHRGDRRKGTEIPYVAHLLGVCDLVLTDGGDEDEAIAALLHDALEDHPDKLSREQLEARFGKRVRRIVEGCTDTPPDYAGGEKPEWRIRKAKHVDHIRVTPPGDLRVAIADKVYNARAIVNDCRTNTPEAVFPRFKAGKPDQQWYYRSLVSAFRDAGYNGRLLSELEEAVLALERI